MSKIVNTVAIRFDGEKIKEVSKVKRKTKYDRARR